jgi:FkbM family methyltransferase
MAYRGDLVKIITRSGRGLPLAGYPLLLSWEKGLIPAPTGISSARLKDGRTLRCDMSDPAQRAMWLGLYEPAATRLLSSLVGPGDTVVDVGARIGWFSTIASPLVGSDGVVVACEPGPAHVAALRQNLELNRARNVSVAETALGCGPGALGPAAGRDRGGIADSGDGTGPRAVVGMSTLDEVAACLPVITLLRIDVGGRASHVLRGGDAALGRTENVLVGVDKAALTKAGSSARELYALLREAGFTSLAAVSRPGPRRLVPDSQLLTVLACR